MRRLMPVVSRLLAVYCCLLLGWSGCRQASDPVATELVPAGSAFVLVVDWHAVHDHYVLRAMASAGELERCLASIGLSETDVASVVVFALARNTDESEALIAVGSFRSQSLIRALRKRGWSSGRDQGYQTAGSPAGDSLAAAVGPGAIVFGRTAGVEAALAAARDSTTRLCRHDPAARLLARYRDEPVYVISLVPQETQDVGRTALGISALACALLGLDALGSLLGMVPTMRALGVALAPSGDDYRSELGLALSDERAASVLAGGFGLAKGLASALSQLPLGGGDGQQALTQANKMNVARDGEIVYISQLLTADEALAR